jgi:hypothetical protein
MKMKMMPMTTRKFLFVFLALVSTADASTFFSRLSRGGSAVIQAEIKKNAAATSSSSNVVLLPPLNNDTYVALSTVVWPGVTSSPKSHVLLEPGVVLDGTGMTEWTATALWERNTAALFKALAFVSDVFVLVLDDREPIEPSLVLAIKAGLLARRKDSGLPKGNVLVVLESSTSHLKSNTDISAWTERLAVSDLSCLTPDIVGTLMIVPSSEFESSLEQLKNIQTMQGGVCRITPITSFSSLLQKVHAAFGGGNKPLLKHSYSSATDTTQVTALLLQTANEALDELLQEQEDSWLDPGAMPLPFGTKANAVLEQLDNDLLLSCNSKHVTTAARAFVEQKVGDRLLQLYRQHLQSLRDYHGHRLETVMDATDNAIAWRDSATHITEAFRKQAMESIPILVRPGTPCRTDMEEEAALAESGLLADIMEAVGQRQDLLPDEDNENGVDPNSKRAQITSWCKKLSMRALVFGFNYLQGWLAWQGIKRAAMEREQQTPKFPLF